MGAQIRMMEADILCPEADVIYFLGSDCIAFKEFKPELYCDAAERPIVLHTSYAILKECHAGAYAWKKGVERVLSITVDYEFMRRLPSVFPRSIFAPMRARVEEIYRQPFANYITKADAFHKNTSEANILGAYAYAFMRSSCAFVDTATFDPLSFSSPIIQFWSHGGTDRPTDACTVLSDGTNVYGRKPRELIDQLLYR